MSRKGERVQWLIDQVGRGVPQEVIDKKTKARKNLWEKRWRRSGESVDNVIAAIESYQTGRVKVLWCRPTEVGGKLDRQKKVDVRVKLEIAGIEGPQYISIQVKSDPDFLKEFLSRYENSLEEGKTPEERAWNSLARKRLVLLNGQDNVEEIQGNFISQLERIMEFRWGKEFDLGGAGQGP